MRKIEFLMLPKLDKEDDFTDKLKIGDKFLFGNRMIEQTENKQIGEEITYYQVIRIKGKNCEYMPRFEILQEDYLDARRKTKG